MLGKRLAILRKSKNLTQQQIADELKISRATYGHYEIGRREPDFDTLQKLANYFGVTIDYLLGRSLSKTQLVTDNLHDLYRADELLSKAEELSEKQVDALIDIADVFLEGKHGVNSGLPKSKIRLKRSAPKEDPVTKLPYWYMRLTALRQERGLSLEEAAKQMGGYMTPDILRSYEKGKAMPDPADQELMSDFYETNWFFISGRVNVRRGYAGETTVAIDAADNEDHPNEPLSYEKRKQLKDVYEKLGLVYDLEEDEENN